MVARNSLTLVFGLALLSWAASQASDIIPVIISELNPGVDCNTLSPSRAFQSLIYSHTTACDRLFLPILRIYRGWIQVGIFAELMSLYRAHLTLFFASQSYHSR
jgi:hypothetical protein